MPRIHLCQRGNSHISSTIAPLHWLDWRCQYGRMLATPPLGKSAAGSVLFPSPKRAFSVRATAAAQQGSIAPTDNVSGDLEPRAPPRQRSRPTRAPTPSEVLQAVLKERGNVPGVYNESKKTPTALSWADPSVNERDGKRRKHLRKLFAETTPGSRPRMAYATIVARYIRDVEPLLPFGSSSDSVAIQSEDRLDEAIVNAFDDDALQYLSSRGYSAEDVVSWAWILTSKNAYTAALRYVKVENYERHGEGRITPPIPLFVLLFILRQRDITAGALGILLSIASHTLRMPREYETSNNLMQSTPWDKRDSTTAMIVVVRLLRVARNVSPPALLSVADLFTSVFGVAAIEERFGRLKLEPHRRFLTTLYNRCIMHLSDPCRFHPYQSVTFQHRAGFHLLREMTKFHPALFVSRKAYQAIIRIQAIREKSGAEREWEDLKAPSWPPWKREKLGIDAERGKQGRKSMAMKAMRLMTRSGYATSRWENVAGIVGGWDTDGTPTIQTRTILPRPNKSREEAEFPTPTDPSAQIHSHPDIWAARIRATRTLNEAWACFLGYREKHPHSVRTGVYLEMIEKLAHAEHLPESSQSTRASSNAIPGDGKEVFPEPPSPRDALYVPSNPPHLHDFVGDMLTADITISRRLLVLILGHVDYELGLNCLSRSFLSEEEAYSVTNRSVKPDPNQLWHIRQIPEDVFAAIVDFFGRSFHNTTVGKPRFKQGFPIALSSRPKRTSRNDSDSTARALVHMCDLMRLRLPRSPRPWNNFLSHLTEPRLEPDRLMPIHLQRPIAWMESREVVRWMDREGVPLDMDTLEILCRRLNNVIQDHLEHGSDAEQRLKELWNRALESKDTVWSRWSLPHETVPELIRDGLDLIKRRFYQLVSHPSPTVASSLPKPLPPQLHSFIRVLGLAGDHDGLLTVLWWIRKSETDLIPTILERLKGPTHMRRAMVAIRVFLEGHVDIWTGNSVDTDAEQQRVQIVRPERHIQAAREIFQELNFLDGWPTDEEVRDYITRHGVDVPGESVH